MARHYRQREILAERRRKSESRGNKFVPLLSKVYRRMEGEIMARPYEGKVQPTTCWGCGEEGHVLWGCPNRAVQPRRAEAQQVRKVEKRKCGKCGGNNHREQRCPSVKLWGEGWGLKRKWHEGKERAIRRGVLVERCERGWVEQEQVVTMVRCVDCGVSGTRAWRGPTWRYYDKDDLRNNRCLECEERWEKGMWDVSRGKRMTRQCRACRKDDSLPTNEWSPDVQGWACNLCVEREEKIASIEREIEKLKAKVAAGGRDVRRTLKPLREVWLEVGIEKLDNHEGVMVKALLDSGATGMFVDKKFVKEHGFRVKKLDRPVEVKNVDETSNSGGNITHELECNVFYRGHHERLRMDICNLGRTKMILGMPWLAAYNLEINWEMGEVKMSRCLPWCGKQIAVEQRKAKVEDGKDLRWMIEDREREEEAREDRQKVEDMVPKRFHKCHEPPVQTTD